MRLPGESPALNKVPRGAFPGAVLQEGRPSGPGSICGPRAPPRAAGRGQRASAALKVVVPVELGDLGTEVAALPTLTDPLASWASVPGLMQLLAAGLAYSGSWEKPQGRGATDTSLRAPPAPLPT